MLKLVVAGVLALTVAEASSAAGEVFGVHPASPSAATALTAVTAPQWSLLGHVVTDPLLQLTRHPVGLR
ncbi:hypothetical protein [Kineococcus sp. SYSU DK003]|uniref:hypothetical protein n=1 Tax=Kineococcus sp. SYSU DK003 TaxID=3383124 RepID=UPI003D7E20A0